MFLSYEFMSDESKKIWGEYTQLQKEYMEKHPELRCTEDDSPLSITIKPEILDTSSVKEDNISKDDFRPTRFEQYIGQYNAKQRILSYIDGCKKFNETFPHTCFFAPAGCGKTVLANILANMLNKKFVKCGAVDIKSEQQLVDKIVECDGGILFVDEFHKISNKLGTFLLPILEERLILGKKIKPFTMITATTHLGNLSENLSALVQRFLPIQLEHYKEEELVAILKQFHKKTYQEIVIPENVFVSISQNAKFTPRIAIRFFREYVYIEDLTRVKQNNKIVKEGVTEQDIKVLKYLQENNGVGKNSISKYLNVEPKTYEFEIEPYLILKEFISVGNRRKITPKGVLFLEGLKNV